MFCGFDLVVEVLFSFLDVDVFMEESIATSGSLVTSFIACDFICNSDFIMIREFSFLTFPFETSNRV